jgi:hypothetical protein
MLAAWRHTRSSPHGSGTLKAVPSDLLTPDLKRRWDEDGWCIIPDAIPSGDVAAAQDALTRLFPTAAEMDEGVDDVHHARWRTWDANGRNFRSTARG